MNKLLRIVRESAGIGLTPFERRRLEEVIREAEVIINSVARGICLRTPTCIQQKRKKSKMCNHCRAKTFQKVNA